MYPESLESTEPYDLVKGHCPHLLEAFEESKKKKATTGRKRTQKEAKASSQPITQYFTKTKQTHQKRLETTTEEKCAEARLSESESENSSKKGVLKNKDVYKSDTENHATGIRTKKAAARPKKSAVKASTKVKEQPALDRIREQEFGASSGGASCGAAANSPLTSVKLETPISSSDLYRRIFMDDSPGTTPNIPNKRSRAVIADRNDKYLSIDDFFAHFINLPVENIKS